MVSGKSIIRLKKAVLKSRFLFMLMYVDQDGLILYVDIIFSFKAR